MKAILLIGGFGTRLRPITWRTPKQLIPIAGKPMLYHVLDLLPPEIDGAFLATGYLQEAIAAQIEREPPKLPVRCVPEATPLGSGGGMRNAGDDASDPFLLLNSDVIANVNVRALIAFHRAHGGIGTMALSEVEDTRPYGVAALGPEDRIERFLEKPEPKDSPSHWINAGVAVWAREVLERIPRDRPVSFEREIVPGLLDRRVFGFRLSGFWEDAGTPVRLLNAQRYLFDSGHGVVHVAPPGTYLDGAASILPGAATAGATIGPYAHIGRDVTVGAGARVSNSVVMDGARIGPRAVIVNSILGPGTEIETGAIVEEEVRGEEPGPTA